MVEMVSNEVTILVYVVLLMNGISNKAVKENLFFIFKRNLRKEKKRSDFMQSKYSCKAFQLDMLRVLTGNNSEMKSLIFNRLIFY